MKRLHPWRADKQRMRRSCDISPAAFALLSRLRQKRSALTARNCFPLHQPVEFAQSWRRFCTDSQPGAEHAETHLRCSRSLALLSSRRTRNTVMMQMTRSRNPAQPPHAIARAVVVSHSPMVAVVISGRKKCVFARNSLRSSAA